MNDKIKSNPKSFNNITNKKFKRITKEEMIRENL
jgi:hypothetical protein